MSIKRHIPNLLTLINLFSGSILVYLTVFYSVFEFKENNNFNEIVMILLGISLVADLLDGMVARWLNLASPIGLQLDSLADMVTFGVFPGFLMTKMLADASQSISIMFPPVAFFGLLITLFSALRLAKFNVDTTQTTYFKGLATPANTILIFGLFILTQTLSKDFMDTYAFYTLTALTIISSFILVADIPLFSFKMKSMKLKDIFPQIILLASAVLLLIFMGLSALAPIILIYIILSIIFKKTFVHA